MASQGDKRGKLQTSGLSALEKLRREIVGENAPPGWHSISSLAEKFGVHYDRLRRSSAIKRLPSKIYASKDLQGRIVRQRHVYIEP